MAILFFRVMLSEMIKQSFKKSTSFVYFYFCTLVRVIEIERNIEANITRDIVSTIDRAQRLVHVTIGDTRARFGSCDPKMNSYLRCMYFPF